MCTNNHNKGFSGGSAIKNPPEIWDPKEIWVRSLGQKEPLEEDVATHSRILSWRISWTEEPGRLKSIGLQRLGYN